jgi:hypothetical protein
VVAQAVKEALTGNPRVWLYPVSSFNGKKRRLAGAQRRLFAQRRRAGDRRGYG